MRYLVLCICLCFSFQVQCQEVQDTVISDNRGIELKWIASLSKYRDYLLRRNPNAIFELKDFFAKCDEYKATPYEIFDLSYNIIQELYFSLDGNIFETIKKAGA